jgi:hypothetical protein
MDEQTYPDPVENDSVQNRDATWDGLLALHRFHRHVRFVRIMARLLKPGDKKGMDHCIAV